jgi:hypothetical protein
MAFLRRPPAERFTAQPGFSAKPAVVDEDDSVAQQAAARCGAAGTDAGCCACDIARERHCGPWVHMVDLHLAAVDANWLGARAGGAGHLGAAASWQPTGGGMAVSSVWPGGRCLPRMRLSDITPPG